MPRRASQLVKKIRDMRRQRSNRQYSPPTNRKERVDRKSQKNCGTRQIAKAVPSARVICLYSPNQENILKTLSSTVNLVQRKTRRSIFTIIWNRNISLKKRIELEKRLERQERNRHSFSDLFSVSSIADKFVWTAEPTETSEMRRPLDTLRMLESNFRSMTTTSLGFPHGRRKESV